MRAALRLPRGLVQHQLGAAFTTLVDFGTMISLVRFLGTPPAWATGAGAGVGALTNFTLGRHVIFRAFGTVRRQVMRYAAVSGASLVLNMIGEYCVHDLLRVQYVLARCMVAVSVSILWNFPMQRRFVFSNLS